MDSEVHLNSNRKKIKKSTVIYIIILLLIIVAAAVVLLLRSPFSGVGFLRNDASKEKCKYEVSYSSFLSEDGWQDFVEDGKTSGQKNQEQSIERLNIKIFSKTRKKRVAVSNVLKLSVYSNNHGWYEESIQNDLLNREPVVIEAFKVNLLGKLSEQYDIYYRAYVEERGWLEWAKNGEIAGTMDLDLGLKAVQIKLYNKNSMNAPVQVLRSYCDPQNIGFVIYNTHASQNNWTEESADGGVSAIEGCYLDAFKIRLDIPQNGSDQAIHGGIVYSSYVPEIGWQDDVKEDNISGTVDEGNCIQAIRIELTGKLSELYDVYYRVGVDGIGTLGWAKNGDTAGSIEHAFPVTSLEVKVCSKNSPDIPDVSEGISCLDGDFLSEIRYSVLGLGNDTYSDYYEAGEEAGYALSDQPLEYLKITAADRGKNRFTGNVSYSVCCSDGEWSEAVSDGNESGENGSGKAIYALKISLTEDLDKYFDVFYQTYVRSYGWLGWAKNGETAGAIKSDFPIEAIKVKLVLKNTEETTEKSFIEPDGTLLDPCPGANYISDGFGYREYDDRVHKGMDFAADKGVPIYAADYGIVKKATYNSLNGNYIFIDHGNGMVTKYLHCNELYVSEGDTVLKGQHIAAVGETGDSNGPHLHFQVEINGAAVNPAKYLR